MARDSQDSSAPRISFQVLISPVSAAGANVKEACSLVCREKVRGLFLMQVLAWHTPGTASYVEYAEGFPSRKRMEEVLGMYIESKDTRNPLAFPLNARDLSGLPPALIFAAERDVLRDEAEQYGARLLAAG